MSGGLVLIFLFLLELFLMAFFSNLLINALSNLFFRITKSQSVTTNLLAVLFLPGTIIHELSHILSAGVLMVHVGEMEFIPKITSTGVRLGSAEIGLTDPFRRALIGLAPFLVGVSLILVSLWLLLPETSNIYQRLLLFYVIFEIGNTMFSSKKDLEGLLALSLTLILVSALIIVAFNFLNIEIPSGFLFNLINPQTVSLFLQKATFFLSIPLLINLGLLFLIKLVFRV